MPSLKSEPLTDTRLLAALGRCTGSVKFIQPAVPAAVLHVNQALAMARTGAYYGLPKRRNLHLYRLPDPRPELPWVDCWRTTEAAVFPPSPTYWV